MQFYKKKTEKILELFPYREFMLALHATSHGSPEEKLGWAFRMYDVDGNGSIDFNEMRRLIQMAD